MACEKDYSKGIIYTIKTDDGLYVGSTVDFKGRKYNHKSHIYNENKKEYNMKLFQNIRQNGGEYRIELYKPFPCNSKRELEKEEEEIRIELNANLNTIRAYRSDEESKEERKEYVKEYREKNRDEINAYKKEWYEKNKEKLKVRALETITCECGCKLTRATITRHRKTKRHLKLMKELNDLL